ncbi:MAG: lysylphosphatidylglycerol synthase transmembrane domain-containing protein [Leptospirales bacterium]
MAFERKHFHLLAGVLISLLALWLSVRNIHFPLLFHALWKGHYGWLFPILLLMNASFFFRALFWRTTLSVTRKVSIAHLYSSVLVGYMGNNLLPFRGGEMVRLLYTKRLEKIGSAVLFSTIFLERFFDVILLTVILFLFFFLHGANGYEGKGLILGGTIALMFFFLLCLVRFRNRLINLFLRVFPPDAKGIRGRIAGMAEQLLHGLSSLASPRHLVTLFGISAVVWFLGLSGCYFYLRIFDLDIHPVLMSFSLLLFTNLAMLLPSSPGGIGVIQFATLYSMRMFGVHDEQAIALSVIYQLVPFTFTTILGWFFIHRQHMSLFDRGSLDARMT